MFDERYFTCDLNIENSDKSDNVSQLNCACVILIISTLNCIITDACKNKIAFTVFVMSIVCM